MTDQPESRGSGGLSTFQAFRATRSKLTETPVESDPLKAVASLPSAAASNELLAEGGGTVGELDSSAKDGGMAFDVEADDKVHRSGASAVPSQPAAYPHPRCRRCRCTSAGSHRPLHLALQAPF